MSYVGGAALPNPIRSWLEVANVASRVVLDGHGLRTWRRELGNCVAAVPALQPAAWSAMRVSDRMTALQRLEDALAAGQDRKSALIIGGSSRGTNGHYSPASNVISVASRSVSARHPRRAVQTLIHEDRHALQSTVSGEFARANAPTRSLAVPASWVRNANHYHDTADPHRYLAIASASLLAEVVSKSLMRVLVPVFAVMTIAIAAAIGIDFSIYRLQPLERDAWATASSVARRAYPRAPRRVANVVSRALRSGVAELGRAQRDAYIG